MQTFFFIQFVIVIFFNSLNNQYQENIKSNDTAVYKQAKIYCWCFKSIKSDSGNSYYISACATFSSVGYNELINEKNLLISVSKGDNLAKLVKVLNKGKTEKLEKNLSNDTRFVIVLTRDNGVEDIYYTSNASSFKTNRNTFLTYDFNIINTISNILNVQIVCPN